MLNMTFWITVLVLVGSIIELLRRKVLREKYAIVWLVMALLLVFGSLFPNLVNQLSQTLGFQFLSNFVLFMFGTVNLFIAMQLSLSLGKTEDQIHTLAEEIAILKSQVDQKSENF
jgi:hypothetical protein